MLGFSGAFKKQVWIFLRWSGFAIPTPELWICDPISQFLPNKNSMVKWIKNPQLQDRDYKSRPA